MALNTDLNARLFRRQNAERLFNALASPPWAFTRTELIAAMWPQADGGPDDDVRSFEQALRRLRKAIKRSGLPLSVEKDNGYWRLVIGLHLEQDDSLQLVRTPVTAPPPTGEAALSCPGED